MRSKVLTLTVALMMVAVTARPELDIQVRGANVDIRAQRVPLQQILDNLSQKTGMKVVYDTEPPQDLVTLDLRGLNMQGAVTELLRGHGLTYAVRMDPTGARVETLLLTHGGGGGAKGAAAPTPPPYIPENEPQPEYYEEMVPNEVPPPPMPEAMPQPSPTPAAYWTPGPVVFPGQIPGATPPPMPTQGDPNVPPGGMPMDQQIPNQQPPG